METEIVVTEAISNDVSNGDLNDGDHVENTEPVKNHLRLTLLQNGDELTRSLPNILLAIKANRKVVCQIPVLLTSTTWSKFGIDQLQWKCQ